MSIITYLAAPYSHPLPQVREARFHAINRCAAALMAEGELVYSPISHSHPIAMDGDLRVRWEYWRNLDLAMLETCSRMLVLMLQGWEKSVGVLAEVSRAKEIRMEIVYIQPLRDVHYD